MIFATLYALFKGDSTQLKATEKDVRKDNELTAASFKKLDEASGKVNNGFLNLAKHFAAVAAAGLSAAGVISGLHNAVKYAIDLNKISTSLNVNVESLDAWGNAVAAAGGTAEGFQGSLKGLAAHFGTTAAIALKTLPQLADAFHRMSRVQALNYGKMLGLDEATILLLQRGRREVDAVIARQKELGVITKHDAEIFQKFDQQLTTTEHSFRSLFVAVAEKILPILTKILESFSNVAQYFRKHSDFIIGALIGIGVAAGIAAIPFVVMNAGIILVTLAVGALIAAFALMYEDLKVYFAGGDSLVGKSIKKWGEWIDWLIAKLKFLRDGFKGLFGISPENSGTAIRGYYDKGIVETIGTGQTAIERAAGSPLNSLSSGSILNKSSANNSATAVNISEITINTQATDAEGISGALGNNLTNYMRQANSQFDDGAVA